MKIAVTAANGQLGKAIVGELKTQIGARDIIGIVRSPDKAKNLGIEIRKGDYKNREEFNLALKGVDRMILISGMDEPQKRIQQHRNVIEAAKQNNVQKIVYTSIIGAEKGNAFSPIVQSNRQTEEDIKNSGLDWAIGRNGIYIEPDLDYINNYVEEGEIRNCAGNGKCAYTSRQELACAYAQLLLNDGLKFKSYNLMGKAITQSELAELINQSFNTKLRFRPIAFEEYLKERQEELGEFLGGVIAGIYEGIRSGAYDLSSDFETVAGRLHQSPEEMIKAYLAGN